MLAVLIFNLIRTLKEIFSIVLTFGLTVIAWIFFRAESLSHAFSYILTIFSTSLFSIPERLPKTTIILLIIFVLIEWWGREEKYAIAKLGEKWPRPLRWMAYYIILMVICFLGNSNASVEFIYFQF